MGMNSKGALVIIMLVLAVSIVTLESVYAQEFLCDHGGPTERGKQLGIVCHTTEDPASMIVPAIPLITGLGIGLIAWIVVSVRKAR